MKVYNCIKKTDFVLDGRYIYTVYKSIINFMKLNLSLNLSYEVLVIIKNIHHFLSMIWDNC